MTSKNHLIDILKKSVAGETNASLKYLEYAKIASDEGFSNIAYLFKSLVAAENIHIKNHTQAIRVIEPGEADFKPHIEPLTPKSTKENLEDAIAGENYETKVMYPDFLKSLKGERGENADLTRLSLTWAKKVEFTHAETLQLALDALLKGHDLQIENIYVCRVCGNLRLTQNDGVCPICGHDANFFALIKRPEGK
jgi:rubrerythrin